MTKTDLTQRYKNDDIQWNKHAILVLDKLEEHEKKLNGIPGLLIYLVCGAGTVCTVLLGAILVFADTRYASKEVVVRIEERLCNYANKEISIDNTGRIVRLEVKVQEIIVAGEDSRRLEIVNQKEIMDKLQEVIARNKKIDKGK